MVGHRRLIAEAMIVQVPFYFLRLILFQAESPIFEEFQSGALFVVSSWSAAEMVVQDAVQTYLFAEP